MGHLDKALEMVEKQDRRVNDHNLIDTTLQEIGEAYKPGLIGWIRRKRPSEWARLLALESEINRAALRSDEVGLVAALAAYRSFFGEMAVKFEETQGMPLFGSLREMERYE